MLMFLCYRSFFASQLNREDNVLEKYNLEYYNELCDFMIWNNIYSLKEKNWKNCFINPNKCNYIHKIINNVSLLKKLYN